jgi:hypothetical protein
VAYQVVVGDTAARQAAGMPAAARMALADVLGQIADDPWSGEPYDARWSPEFRTITFGSGGLATYVISERRQTVLVESVIWTD